MFSLVRADRLAPERLVKKHRVPHLPIWLVDSFPGCESLDSLHLVVTETSSLCLKNGL